MRGKPYQGADLSVIAAAAAVRPWNAPSSATTRVLPVARKARRSAFSFASAPLLTKKTREKPSGPKSSSRLAARARTASGTTLLWKKSSAAWAPRRARSFGWA